MKVMIFDTYKKTKNLSSQAGMTLPEVLVSSAVGSIVMVILLVTMVFISKAAYGLGNYYEIEKISREAVNQMSREVRSAIALGTIAPDRIELITTNGTQVTYYFDNESKQLKRSDPTKTTTVLDDCESFEFKFYQAAVTDGTYDHFEASTASDCKMIKAIWVISKEVAGSKLNSKRTLSALIGIRNKR